MKAFPVKGWNGHEETINEGMDLRDYFAGQIIQGLLANTLTAPNQEIVIKAVWGMADAMMEAREK